MSKIDFIYDNVPRSDPNFYDLVANALAEEIENNSENDDNDLDFGASEIENELEFEASDVEAEHEIEVAEEYSSSSSSTESDDDLNTDEGIYWQRLPFGVRQHLKVVVFAPIMYCVHPVDRQSHHVRLLKFSMRFLHQTYHTSL